MSMTDYLAFGPTWLPVVIFCARVTDVSMGTLCMICTVRGHKLLAVLVSFVEIVIWVYAASSVLTHLDNLANVVAYAGGFATGRALGMWVESKLALGTEALTFISQGSAQAVAERLRFADHCVTTLTGNGRDGPVAICHAILPRKLASSAIRMAREVDPDVVVTVEDVRTTAGGYLAHYGAGKTPLSWRRLAQRHVLASRKHLAAAPASADRAAVSNDDDYRPVSRAA
ncbi:MAG: hypothetical protein JSU86_17945 [Phycisphaerales bacterium]|nr:MAG: hypothetical protein JSU86_17945 [Phycisphaerales bacterium]